MLFFAKEKKDTDLPSKLIDIENRLLEIEEEKPMRIHNLNENFSGDTMDHLMESDAIDYLDIEKAKLLLKRQFLLDKRNSWKNRIIWDILVPIFLSGITAYFVSK